MIEVVTFSRGGEMLDRAEAETPDVAIYTARVLLDDASAAGVHSPTASFYTDGKLVRSKVTRTDLNEAGAGTFRVDVWDTA